MDAKVEVNMGVIVLSLPPIEVVAETHGREVILGRNLLNKLTISLHSPKRIIEVDV
jgi:hypothetical protein